jgi:hypothetical protein
MTVSHRPPKPLRAVEDGTGGWRFIDHAMLDEGGTWLNNPEFGLRDQSWPDMQGDGAGMRIFTRPRL